MTLCGKNIPLNAHNPKQNEEIEQDRIGSTMHVFLYGVSVSSTSYFASKLNTETSSAPVSLWSLNWWKPKGSNEASTEQNKCVIHLRVPCSNCFRMFYLSAGKVRLKSYKRITVKVKQTSIWQAWPFMILYMIRYSECILWMLRKWLNLLICELLNVCMLLWLG